MKISWTARRVIEKEESCRVGEIKWDVESDRWREIKEAGWMERKQLGGGKKVTQEKELEEEVK